MNKRYLAPLAACVAILAVPAFSPASPVTIYSNFGSGLSYDTTEGNPIGNIFDGNNYAEGASFMLPGDATFSSLSLALSCVSSCADSFLVSLAYDAANEPGLVLETFSVGGGALGLLGSANAPLVLNSVLNLTLTAGTRYWITVRSDLNDSIAWNLNLAGDATAEAISSDGGISWFSPSGNTPGAFEVDGIVAEPGSIGMVIGAGLLLGIFAKRRT